MRIEQEKIATAEEFIRDEYEQNDGELASINCEGHHVKYMIEEHLKRHLKAIRYEYNQYQFFINGYRNGYRNGSTSISECTAAHDRFLKLLE